MTLDKSVGWHTYHHSEPHAVRRPDAGLGAFVFRGRQATRKRFNAPFRGPLFVALSWRSGAAERISVVHGSGALHIKQPQG